ncbi:SAV_915 family protein [Streptomyces sp. NPDC004980]
MRLFQNADDDPEPEEPSPAGLLYVPVRPGGGPKVVVRLFRTPLGTRTAVGFTTEARLASTFGGKQPRIRLSESALRALTEPLGAALVTVDPTFAAPQAAPAGTGARVARPVTAAARTF